MHIILGATGHVGSSVADSLLEKGEKIIVTSRDPDKVLDLQKRGAEVAVNDIHDTAALRRTLERGKRLFLLNPPASPSGDTDSEEKRSIASIVAALENSGMEKVVALSVCGAQAGEKIGDVGTLFTLEQALEALPLSKTIVRAAYYMSNWDASLESARKDGVVKSFYPADFQLPMVAPHDIGRVAADLMVEPNMNNRLVRVEGPQLYSSADVAAAFAVVLNRPVIVETIPPEQWISVLREMGFSDIAAESFAGMTHITLNAKFTSEIPLIRGETALQNYVRDLVARS